MTLRQQMQLAREKAPVGGGYVCLIRTQGSNTWNFALATQVSAEAEGWSEAQDKPARVWQVRACGEALIRSSK